MLNNMQNAHGSFSPDAVAPLKCDNPRTGTTLSSLMRRGGMGGQALFPPSSFQWFVFHIIAIRNYHERPTAIHRVCLSPWLMCVSTVPKKIKKCIFYPEESEAFFVTRHWHMFISFFMQWLRKPIWGYPLREPCADMIKSTFLIPSYGGTRLPDTGKSVVPWVILDWWTPLHCGGKPEKELWLVTTGWLSGIWPARMGRRLNKRARSNCPIMGQMDALLSGSSFARQESWCISARGWAKYHPYVLSQMKKPDVQ